MALRIAKELCCDFCRVSVRLDAPTLKEEWPTLRKDGWRKVKGWHLCPTCAANRKPTN
jgi:hypothetical protein